MADNEDIQPLVCDNGTGMVKVNSFSLLFSFWTVLVMWTLEVWHGLIVREGFGYV